MHLSLYCAVAACFALVLYYLMQPTRLPNPGMAAHNASSRMVSYVELLRSERQAAERDVAERDVRVSRTRPARRPQPIEGINYAAQPSFGAYRPMY